MAKNKQISSKSVKFLPSHSGHMFGKSGVTNQQPGTGATTRGSPSGGKGGSAVTGGRTKMFGKQTVKAAKPL